MGKTIAYMRKHMKFKKKSDITSIRADGLSTRFLIFLESTCIALTIVGYQLVISCQITRVITVHVH